MRTKAVFFSGWCPSHFCKKESLCSKGKLQEHNLSPVIFHRLMSQTTWSSKLKWLYHQFPLRLMGAAVVCGGKRQGCYDLSVRCTWKTERRKLLPAFIPSLVLCSLYPSTCRICSQLHCYFAFLSPVGIACGLCGFECRTEEHVPHIDCKFPWRDTVFNLVTLPPGNSWSQLKSVGGEGNQCGFMGPTGSDSLNYDS